MHNFFSTCRFERFLSNSYNSNTEEKNISLTLFKAQTARPLLGTNIFNSIRNQYKIEHNGNCNTVMTKGWYNFRYFILRYVHWRVFEPRSAGIVAVTFERRKRSLSKCSKAVQCVSPVREYIESENSSTNINWTFISLCE